MLGLCLSGLPAGARSPRPSSRCLRLPRHRALILRPKERAVAGDSGTVTSHILSVLISIIFSFLDGEVANLIIMPFTAAIWK